MYSWNIAHTKCWIMIHIYHRMTSPVYLQYKSSLSSYTIQDGGLVDINAVLSQDDPCNNYRILYDDGGRSIQCSRYYSGPNDRFIDEGWRRVQLESTGEDLTMPTYCISHGYCGSKRNVWLDNTHPTGKDGIVDRMGYLNMFSSCCYVQYPIQIKNCTDYMVYNLKRTLGSDERYCFGDSTLCNQTTPPTSKPTRPTTVSTTTTANLKRQTVDEYNDQGSVLCDKKQFLPFTHAPNRSVDYDETTSLNDRFMREGWYGALDFIIPSVQPARGHCGAKYPMFLQSEPGLERKKVDVIVCINDCETRMIIKAVKCSERLTVYRLKRPPISNAVYCLDGIESVLPDFHTTVTISTGLQPVPGADFKQEFIFNCSFPNPNNGSLTYKATWFVNDVVVYESPYTDYNDINNDRRLTDTRLSDRNINTVGFQLRCDIKAAIVTEGKRRLSLPSTSQQKFIGIEVLDPVINLKEGDTAFIKIRSTVPIGCTTNNGCTLTVSADIPKGVEDICAPTSTADGGCGFLIRTKAWSSSYRLEITSTVTKDYGETLTQKKVFLRTDKLYFNQPIWQNYTLNPVTINIAKNTSFVDGRRCSIYTRTFLAEFTGRRTEIHLNGTFYLLIMDNIEVQVQITDCTAWTWGYCVCGVVVRVGRTVYLISHCNLEYWYIDYVLKGEGSDVLNVLRESERVLEMYLPRGTKIRVVLTDATQYQWLVIYIDPSVRDIGKTSGLCGELTEDELHGPILYNNSFFNTWRVKNDVSLFDPDNWETFPDEREAVRFLYCRCDEVEDDKLATTLKCAPITGTTCSSDTDYTLHMSKMNQSLACMQCVYCCLKHTVKGDNATVKDISPPKGDNATVKDISPPKGDNATVKDISPPKDNSTNFLVIGISVAVVVVLIVVISILAICLVRNKKGLVSTRSNVDSPTSNQDNTYDSISQPIAHIYEGLR